MHNESTEIKLVVRYESIEREILRGLNYEEEIMSGLAMRTVRKRPMWKKTFILEYIHYFYSLFILVITLHSQSHEGSIVLLYTDKNVCLLQLYTAPPKLLTQLPVVERSLSFIVQWALSVIELPFG